MRILLVVDSHDWCFGHMAHGIQKYADCEVVVVDSTEINLRDYRGFDATCYFSYAEMKTAKKESEKLISVLAHPGWMHHRVNQPELTSQMRNIYQFTKKMQYVDRILCFNNELKSFCDKYPVDARRCYPCVDTEIYKPTKPVSGLRVGWCGQPCYQKNLAGFMQSVVRNIPDCEPVINLRKHTNCLTQQEMVEWYNSIDVFVCTSIAEGGPLPILEAMACGRPVFSTDVGIASAVGNGCAVAPIENLARMISDARHGLAYLGELARENVVANWSWLHGAKRWVTACTDF